MGSDRRPHRRRRGREYIPSIPGAGTGANNHQAPRVVHLAGQVYVAGLGGRLVPVESERAGELLIRSGARPAVEPEEAEDAA